MRKLIDKNNLFVAVSFFLAGIIIILGSSFLISAGQIAQSSILVGGFLVSVMGVLILFKESRIVRYMMPSLYFLIGIIYLVAFIMDVSKGLLGMNIVAEVVCMVLFITFGVVAIFKLFLNKKSFYISAIEVTSAFVMGACVFFVLFSNASFGYKFSKMNTTEALQIFYLLLVFGGYTIIAISNSIYPMEEQKKSR